MEATTETKFLADLTAGERSELNDTTWTAYLDSAGTYEDYSAFVWRKSPTIPGRYSLLVNGVQIGWATKEGREWSAVAAQSHGHGVILFTDLATRKEAAVEIAHYQSKVL